MYLHDDTTNDVRTQITGHNGHYLSSGIRYRRDYRIHAEYDGLVSRSHRISAYRTDRTIRLELKVNRKKTIFAGAAQIYSTTNGLSEPPNKALGQPVVQKCEGLAATSVSVSAFRYEPTSGGRFSQNSTTYLQES